MAAPRSQTEHDSPSEEAPTPQPLEKETKRDSDKLHTEHAEFIIDSEPPESDCPYVDSHCHAEYILERMRVPSVEHVFAGKSFPSNFEACVSVFCDPAAFSPSFGTYPELLAHPFVYGAFGMHPHNAKYYDDRTEAMIEECLKHPKAVAWGECGLDFAKKNSPKQVQRDVFRRQLKRAVELSLPVVVHSRDAPQETLEIMSECLPREWLVHLHCFGDSADHARVMLAEFPNLCIGFTGAVTFRNAHELREAVKVVPLDRLLLETDGPYMHPNVPEKQPAEAAPQPKGKGRKKKKKRKKRRGTPCHPGHIPYIAHAIALIKDVSIHDVYIASRQATRLVYGI